MAQFNYDIIYKGTNMTQKIGRKVVAQIEKAIEKGDLPLDSRMDPNYVGTYRTTGDTHRVLVGITC